MFLLKFVVRPKPDHARSAEIEGAVVTCWMDLDSLDASKAAALDLLSGDGWDIVSVQAEEAVERERVTPEGLPYYERALVDKTVLVVHMWKRRA